MEKVLRKWALVLFFCCVGEVRFVPIALRNKVLGSANRVLSSDKNQLYGVFNVVKSPMAVVGILSDRGANTKPLRISSGERCER